MLWIYQVFALSAGLYGCQVWATKTLTFKSAATTKVHIHHVSFLKMLLGVKRSTNTHCLHRETGQLPLYFYWFCCVARFWNSLLTSNNALLSKINDAYLRLAHRGVKRGCPLSPSIFSLYINDVDCIAREVHGAVTGIADICVTHMLYADYLSLIANEPGQLRIVLDRLSAYALRKGLIVNTKSKSEVVHSYSRCTRVPAFRLGGLQLANKDSFKYLGMVFT